MVQAWKSASQAGRFGKWRRPWMERLRLQWTTTFLHLLQPLARLTGRIRHGLAPLRFRGSAGRWVILPQSRQIWSEEWQGSEVRLKAIEENVLAAGAASVRGGEFDNWDLEAHGGGILGAARLRMGIEEHGAGRQLLRFRVWPQWPPAALAAALVLFAMGAAASFGDSWAPAAVLLAVALQVVLRTIRECAASANGLLRAIEIGCEPAGHVREPARSTSLPARQEAGGD